MSPRRLLTATSLALALLVLVAIPVRAQACSLADQVLTCPSPSDPLPAGPEAASGGLLTVPGDLTDALVDGGGGPVVDTEGARRLLELANQERGAVGAQPLTSRADLVDLALEHTLSMAEQGTVFHNLDLTGRPLQDELDARIVGENVGWSTDVEDLHRRFMASPGHRASLLEPRFSVVGMAVVRTPNGRYYATQDFAQPRSGPAPALPPAPPPAPAPALPRPAPVLRPPATPAVAPVAAPEAPEMPAPAPVVAPLTSPTPVHEAAGVGSELVLGEVSDLSAPGPGPDATASRTATAVLAATLAAVVAVGDGAWLYRDRRPARGRSVGVRRVRSGRRAGW